LNLCLETIAEVYVDVAADSGQKLVLKSADHGSMSVDGDQELLVQLFANLVENAIRHAPAGSHIEISASITPDAIRIDIADDGPGIPEAEREKVFQRLYRLDKSRTTQGTGLGLSLVKAIADLHHATIELLDNRPGLRVVMRFPILRQQIHYTHA
jgi:signal transduction histidine kinase